MIDTNKLLSNRSGGSTTLSRKSVINIGLIREDVIKIDGLLKSRLVLSKVRDGIERQSLERLRRKSREDDLEIDDDRDDNNRRRDPDPKPKKGRGLIGFLIGGALAVIGGIAMKFLPIILSLGKFIGRISKVFTFVIGGTFAAIGNFISLFNDGSKKIKGIDKDQLDEGYVNDVFTNFNGALDALVTSLIVGGAISMGIKTVMGRNAKTAVKSLKKEATPSNIKKSDEKPAPVKKRGRPRNSIEVIREGINKRSKTMTFLRPAGSGKPVPFKRRRPRKKQDIEDILNSESFKKKARKIKKRKSETPKKEKVTADKIKKEAQKEAGGGAGSGKNIKKIRLTEEQKIVNAAFSDNVSDRLRRIIALEKNLGIKFKPEEIANIKNMSPQNFLRFYSDYYDISEGFGPPEAPSRSRSSKIDPNQTLFDKMFKDVRTGKGGMGIEDPFGKINPENFFEDPKGGPGAMKINKALLKQRGGIVRILSNIGGDAFVETFKQGLKGSIGVIPILGDVFGFLLDYYVFGESPGRAAFKAIGSFALSSLIGAVGLALGGPVGAFIGGMLGGIGGDILGGIAYDLFFGTDGGVSAKSSATKGAVKGAVTQTFEDGGYVGEPSFKPLVNSVDKSINLRTTPSYARGGGKVKFIPLPIPIPTGQSQEEEEQVSVTSNTIETKTFAGLYER